MKETDFTTDEIEIRRLVKRLAKRIESVTNTTKSQHGLNQDIEDIDNLNKSTENFLQEVSTRKPLTHEFLTKINHELGTPLVQILSYTDMLLDSKHGQISDEQRKRLEIVHSSTKELVQTIQDLFNEKTFDVTSDNPEAGKDYKINELKQEKSILDRINTALSGELEKIKKENSELEKDSIDDHHKIKEMEQVRTFASKSAQDEQEKNSRLQKKHILTMASCIAIIGITVTAYSLFAVDPVGQQYRIPNTGQMNSGYVIQNLQGDTVNTWISWRIADGSVIHVNLVNAKKYPGKLDLVKEVILSNETINIDDSLLNKGPQGSTSTYYMGWVGALKNASKTPTEFVIPTKFEVIESSKGQGEITITLSDERSADGYTGYTRSIAYDVQNQILKSDISIYEVYKLSDDQFKTILRHELGHALGLAHSSAIEDLMAPIIQTDYPYISGCDIDAIKSLYDGNKKSEVICKK